MAAQLRSQGAAAWNMEDPVNQPGGKNHPGGMPVGPGGPGGGPTPGAPMGGGMP